MNIKTEYSKDTSVVIVRVDETKLTYPLLAEFSKSVSNLVNAGNNRIVLDLDKVAYMDSSSIGCLMDLYRQISQTGGSIKLCNTQKRVETMLAMTGTQKFIELHTNQSEAVNSFGE